MIRSLLALAALPLTLGFYNSFENNADLARIAPDITAVVGVNAGSAFDLGGDRTVGGALDSCLFQYTSCTRF